MAGPPRPLRITVETTTLDGQVAKTTYHRGLARLIHHEIDHLDGLLYTARMRDRYRSHPGRGVSADRTLLGLQAVVADVCRAHPRPPRSFRRRAFGRTGAAA
ncbi:peptide deformylase [Streptomyces sp. cmx-18-6]|uniref:peptide deformylase n=1 Tax=Streptomyces sp. cmx-18-6 TaxID=2790930 RepID=UPI00397FFEF8